jgi:hypothetical protein
MSVNSSTWSQAEQHYRSGDAEAARHACESLLGTRFEHPGVHWMLSRLYQDGGWFRLSARHAGLAAASAEQLPPKPRLAATSGLISVGEYEAALRILSRADVNSFRDTELLCEVIDQLSSIDEHGIASEWLAAAGKLGMDTSGIAFLRGNNQKYMGRADRAAIAYERSIALAPANPHPHLGLATLSLVDGGSARVDRLRRLIAKVNSQDAVVLGYALFRELDLLGDVDAGWIALRDAMGLKRASIRHDRSAEDAMFDRLIDTYTDDYVRAQEGTSGKRVPIFIVGMPRTGTTLIERILGNHPQVAACGELSELRMALKWASDYYCPAFLDTEAASRLEDVDAHALGDSYRRRTAWRGGRHHWFTDKHPGNFLFCGLILRAIPEAKIISVRRNAIDSCFANMRELFARHYYEYSYSIEDVVAHYRNYARLTSHFSDIAPGRIMEVEYESFVQTPEPIIADILNRCGLAPLCGITEVVDRPQPISSASSLQVREPIHDRRIDYWKRYAQHLGPLVKQLDSLGCLKL